MSAAYAELFSESQIAICMDLRSELLPTVIKICY